MNPIVTLFTSSIGRKFLMAITGLVLVLFVIGHLVGNLQVFSPPDKLNGYAHFLQSLGPALWVARISLLLCAAIHIWAAVVLTIESKRARGAESYGVSRWLKASLSSRYMRHTGVVILAFIVYHIAHFTLGAAQSGSYKTALPEYTMTSDYHILGVTVVAKNSVPHVHDVYSMVFLGFSNVWVSLFYIIAVGLLSLHMLHGIQSSFQTIGWRNEKWGQSLRGLATLFCLAYFLLNAAIPGSILTGALKPAPNTHAAHVLTGADASTAANEFKR